MSSTSKVLAAATLTVVDGIVAVGALIAATATAATTGTGRRAGPPSVIPAPSPQVIGEPACTGRRTVQPGWTG